MNNSAKSTVFSKKYDLVVKGKNKLFVGKFIFLRVTCYSFLSVSY